MKATPPLPDWIRDFRHPGYTSVFELLPGERKLYCTEGLLGDWDGEVLLLAKDAMPVHIARQRIADGDPNPWRHGVRGKDLMGWRTNERVLELDGVMPGTSLYGSALAQLMKNEASTSGPLQDMGPGPLRNHVRAVLCFVVSEMQHLRAIVCLGNDAWELVSEVASLSDHQHHPRGPAAEGMVAGKALSLFRLYHPSRAFRGGWGARRAEWQIVADTLRSR